MNITAQKASDIIEAVIAKGDIAQLSSTERARYYVKVCESIGLNPMTRPFEYITLNGRLVLYARKDCTDQLRSIYGVSITDLSERERDGVFTIIAKVTDKYGRTDMSTGAVNIASLQGEPLANAMMKAETKAKRRATLSICGLGFLDESELPAAASNVPPSPPQHRPRLADQLDALTREPEKRTRRGRPKKTDDAEHDLPPADDPVPDIAELDLVEIDPAPDDEWPGPRPDFEQGKRDRLAGRTGCLDRDVRDDPARLAEWQKGFNSKARP